MLIKADTSSSKSPPTSSSGKSRLPPGSAASCSAGASAQSAKGSCITSAPSSLCVSCSVSSKLVLFPEPSTLSPCTTNGTSYNGALAFSSVQVFLLVLLGVCLLMLWHTWMELVATLVSFSSNLSLQKTDKYRLALDLHHRRPADNSRRHHIQMVGQCRRLAGDIKFPN